MTNQELEIRNNNIRFRKANKARKRVMIAKDVLDQIRLEKYVPSCLYFVLDNPTSETVINQQNLQNDYKCRLCGIGAAFASAVRLGNSFEAKTYALDSQPIREVLSKYFSNDQILMIENYYENWGVAAKKWNRHNGFWDRIPRMIAIFQNVIDNKGEFKP